MTVKFSIVILAYVLVVKSIRAEISGNIHGGENSSIEDFPHSVFLYIKPISTCGASILTQAILLTAAHCVLPCQSQTCKITAYVGSERQRKGLVRLVINIKTHEKYNTKTKANDIALLKLDKSLMLGKTVKRIIVMKNPPKYKYARVAGWGQINEFEDSLVLQHTRQKVMDRHTCKKIVQNVPNGTLCAQDNSHPHRGDSGGALVVNKRTIQIGIVSYMRKQPTKNDTIVYTDVAYHYNWIIENVRDLYCRKKFER